MTQDETEHGRTDELPDDRPLPGDGTYPAVAGRTDDRPPPEDRPMPGDGTRDTGTRESDGSDDATSDDATSDDTKSDDPKSDDAKSDDAKSDDAKSDDAKSDDGEGDDDGPPPGPDAEPVYNDRDKLDFDPDEGFYTGTAVTGDTEIPGEHERVDDVPIEEDGDDAKSSDDSDDSDDESA